MSKELVAANESLMKQLAGLSGGALDEETKQAAGVGSTFKRISIRGGVFRKVVGGKEVATVPDRFMHVIFVKIAPHPSRNFYPEAYIEGKKVSPICWSTDAETPNSEVKTPQAKSCRECPNSVKGSSRDGTSTACRISWRVAVVLPNDPSGDVMAITFPGASVWGEEEGGKRPFLTYLRYLRDNNVSAGRVVTRMEFDLDNAAPRLLFSPAAVVPDDTLPIIEAQNKTKEAEMAVILNVFQGDEGDTETIAEEKRIAEEKKAEPVSVVAQIKADPFKPVATQPATATAEPEPVLREPKKAIENASAPSTDVASTIKKWAAK